MSTISILLLGDIQRAEFREAETYLVRWSTVRWAATVDAAAAELSEHGFVPDVLVVVQAFPGQFSRDSVDRLRRLAPLARVLGLLGSWCEGETRTGSPWPATMRTYWHQWPARCQRELRRLADGQCSSWALPVTASDEERLLADTAAVWSRRQGLIVIDTPSPEMHSWLSAACRGRGFSTVWQRRPETARITGAAAAIFDGGHPAGLSSGSQTETSLRHFGAQVRPAPVIALLDFPRIEDAQRALAAGAAAVLSKPLAVEDLLWQLDWVG